MPLRKLQSLAERHTGKIRSTYYLPSLYKSTTVRGRYVKLEITFNDGSTIVTVMSKQQHNHIDSTSLWKDIKSIRGLGNVTLI